MNPELETTIRPLVIAHRGASGEAPENTIKAFDIALAQEADGVELDVFLTKDKEVIVTHDEDLKRLTGQNLKTRELTLSQIKQLDFGEGENIPTLREIFDRFGKKFKLYNIEVKSTGFFTDGIEEKLIELIRQYNFQDRVIISSFNPLHLFRIEKKAPDMRTGYLVSPVHFWSKRNFFIRLSRADTINLDYAWCDKKRLEKYRKFGKKIWVWTVNKDKAMIKWLGRGVDAIITNYPARLKVMRDNPELARRIG